MLETEIGQGCFGTCFLPKFSTRKVVMKQQQDCLTARLSHANTICFIGIVQQQNRIQIATNFNNINGERLNLGDIPVENASMNWTYLLSSL